MTEQVSSADWQAKVVNAEQPVLVDFAATWCGPCKAMSPVIDEIAAEIGDSALVYKIDVDENPDIAQEYRVMSIPAFVVFKNGEPAARLFGIQSKEDILELLG